MDVTAKRNRWSDTQMIPNHRNDSYYKMLSAGGGTTSRLENPHPNQIDSKAYWMLLRGKVEGPPPGNKEFRQPA